ncbi:MAG: L-threonylcarbamoyladenylate synthase [Bacteroidota bacterium]
MAEIGTDIQKAKDIIENGGLVAIPTETVYGLAANALNPEAIASVYRTKSRPSFDPLIAHLPSIEQAERYTLTWTQKASKLATKFWPGPLTLLLPKRDIIPDMVTSGLQNVAVRIPKNKLTLELLDRLTVPLVAPSANPFGYVSPTSPVHVNDQLGGKIPYILDGGSCNIGLESTIIGFDKKDNATVYRLGGLDLKTINNEIGYVKVTAHSSSNPKAPGMLKSHYSPSVTVRMGDISQRLESIENVNRVGVISFQKEIEAIPLKNQVVLAPDGDTSTAAKNLFSALRYMDTLDIDILLVEPVPDRGLGRAVNDRLTRAAAT